MPSSKNIHVRNTTRNVVLCGLAATMIAGGVAQPAFAADSNEPNNQTLSDAGESVQNLNPDKGHVVSVETSERNALTNTKTNEKPTNNGDNPGATMGQSLKGDKNVGHLDSKSKSALGDLAEKLPDSSLKEDIAENANTSSGPTATPTVFKAKSVMKTASYVPYGIQGMDVSGFQPVIDWSAQAAGGASFAYIKATEGDYYKSPAFNDQYTGSYNAGLYRGAYHFAYPQVGTGASQADYFINNGGGWSNDGHTLPGLLDVEYNPYGQICYNMTQDQMRVWIRSFSDRYKARTGKLPAIYSTTDWWKTCTGNTALFNDHPLHIASYNGAAHPGELFSGRNGYDIWQYSDHGPYAGDSNLFGGNASKLEDFATNSFYTPIGGQTPAGAYVKPAPKPVVKPANSVVVNGYTIRGGIFAKYKGMKSTLGVPTMNEKSDGMGGVYQTFKNGRVNNTLYWSSKNGTHAITTTSGIGSTWYYAGQGRGMGVPINDASRIPGGLYQSFVKDGKVTKVMWSEKTGTHSIKESEAIGKSWKSNGFERGWGFPLSDQSAIKGANGVQQTFMKNGKKTTVYFMKDSGTLIVM